MFDLSVRAKSYLVIILMVSCFGLLYPKILHPMLLHLLGLSHNEPIQNDFIHPRDRQMRMNDAQSSPRSNRAQTDKSPGRSSGIMTMVLPVYAIGIVFYLIYTLIKVFGTDKSKSKQHKRESILKNYYKDFHYDPSDGEFKLNYGSDNNPELLDDIGSQTSYRYNTPNDIYNCTKNLPFQLETLLQKVDDKSINEDEMHQLRLRLEETEAQLTRILSAMEHLENRTSNLQNNEDEIPENLNKENPLNSDVNLNNDLKKGADDEGVDDEFYDCQLTDSNNVIKQRKSVPVRSQ